MQETYKSQGVISGVVITGSYNLIGMVIRGIWEINAIKSRVFISHIT